MSDEIAEQPKPKRKGRPPGKKAKRHDPEDRNVLGDVEKDVVFGKEDGKRYAWLTEAGIDADAPKFIHRGFKRVERREGGPRPAWDIGSESGSGYAVGGLALYEADEEMVAKHDERDRRRSDHRLGLIGDAARASGGHFNQTTETH